MSAYAGQTDYVYSIIRNENTLFGKDLFYFLLGKKDKIYKGNKASL